MKDEVKKAIELLAAEEILPWVYEREIRSIYSNQKLKYKVGDKVILQTKDGEAIGEVRELQPGCILREVYRIYVNLGYVWWREDGISGLYKG